jgi:hypothetical protein
MNGDFVTGIDPHHGVVIPFAGRLRFFVFIQANLIGIVDNTVTSGFLDIHIGLEDLRHLQGPDPGIRIPGRNRVSIQNQTRSFHKRYAQEKPTPHYQQVYDILAVEFERDLPARIRRPCVQCDDARIRAIQFYLGPWASPPKCPAPTALRFIPTASEAQRIFQK